MTKPVDHSADSDVTESAKASSWPWPARVGWGLFSIAYLIFGMVAVMCLRDDRGELVLINRIDHRLPAGAGRPRVTMTRQLPTSGVVGVATFAVPLTVLAGLREAGLFRASFVEKPYPEMKLYDPYGHREDAGKPGLFYR